MKNVQELAVMLRSKDGIRREQSRNDLVTIGKPALSALHGLLSDPDPQVRWEACKALGSIRDSSSMDVLTSALSDDSAEVRWLAAEALIAFGREAIVPLLQALETHFESVLLRQGAHHILHALERQKELNGVTLTVLDKLRSLEPHSVVALSAFTALQTLRK